MRPSLRVSCHVTFPVDNNHGNYNNPDLDHLLGIDVRKMKRAGALFLMKLKEIHHLPQTAIDDIVEGYSNLMTFQIAWLHSAVRAKLSELAVEEDACDDTFTDIIHPFDGLRTRTQQENYIKKEFNLVVSLTSSRLLTIKFCYLKFVRLTELFGTLKVICIYQY